MTTATALLSTPLPGQDILMALETSGIPEMDWKYGDDLCDCTFQRIGMWTNPYLGRTLKVRLCCIWAKLYTMFPECVQEIPGFMDYNDGDKYIPEPAPWDGDSDMPRHLWHRQAAVQMGLPLPVVRKLLADQEPPKAVSKKKVQPHADGSVPRKVLRTLRSGNYPSAAAGRGERPTEGRAGQAARGGSG